MALWTRSFFRALFLLAFMVGCATATVPAYVSRIGPENPLDGESVGLNSTPNLVDLDADGDLDLVSGERDGTFEAYYLPEPSRGLLVSAGIALLGLLRRRR